jgi:ribonuclease HI
MVPLHRRAISLLHRLPEAAVSHVRREQNKDADRLANQALDEKASRLD